jgi:hypothetical protein
LDAVGEVTGLLFAGWRTAAVEVVEPAMSVVQMSAPGFSARLLVGRQRMRTVCRDRVGEGSECEEAGELHGWLEVLKSGDNWCQQWASDATSYTIIKNPERMNEQRIAAAVS